MQAKTIKEIKKLMDKNKLNQDLVNQLKTDSRKGIQRLLAMYEKKQAEKVKRKELFMKMYHFDQRYKKSDSALLAGVDEAGRGPLAGPVVAAAVILPIDFVEIGLNDSKQVSEGERRRLFEVIKEKAISYSIAVVDNDVIDEINILNATKKAMATALQTLAEKPDLALIDAVTLDMPEWECHAVVKGDEKSSAIAAASILAKVTRDEIMDEIDKRYPAYDFKNNKGYGTQQHIAALESFGPCPYHRKTFTPVQVALNKKEDV